MTRTYVLLLLAGCGLSKETRLAAEQTVSALPEAKASVAQAAASFEEKAAASGVPNLAVTLEREKTRDGFSVANEALGKAEGCVSELSAFLVNDRDDQESDVQSKTAICGGLMENAKAEAAVPGETLARWESLTTGAYERREAAQALAADGYAFYDQRLGAEGSLVPLLRDQMRLYPAKRGDITSRMLDIEGERDALRTALAAAESHVSALSDETPGYDAANFERALAEAEEADETLRSAVDDLTEKARELDESWSLVLTGLTRTCTFTLHYTEWTWHSETYGDGTAHDRGWKQVSEDEWFSTAENQVVGSSGSDYYSGTETEVDDKDIQCRHSATTHEVRNGEAGESVTADVDEDTFEDSYASARQVHDLFPDLGVIQSMTVSSRTDPEDQAEPGNPYSPLPLAVQMELSLVIETKAKGEYDDDATESPGPANVPVQYVGDPQYGEWRADDAGNQSWHWNDFALGYLLAQNSGYYLSPFPYAAFAPYGTWRNASGWDCPPEQRDRYGNCPRRYHSHGYYRSWHYSGYDDAVERDSRAVAVPGRTGSTSRSVRGAGPSTRSRGMGGGGK